MSLGRRQSVDNEDIMGYVIGCSMGNTPIYDMGGKTPISSYVQEHTLHV